MTIDEFLEKLKETPRDWFFAVGKAIRRPIAISGMSCLSSCPIASVRDVKLPTLHWRDAALEIGLTPEDASSIVMAADKAVRHDVHLRARLLDACGLSPSGARTT